MTEMYKLNPHLSYQEVNRYLLNRTNRQRTIWAYYLEIWRQMPEKKNTAK